MEKLFHGFSLYMCGGISLMQQMFTRNPAKALPCAPRALLGKVCMVTGASSGVGFETAVWLGLLGAHVVVTCRDTMRKSRTMLEALKRRAPAAQFTVLPVDLGDVRSIITCVEEFKRLGLPLHMLINNAGVMLAPFQLTVSGFELHHMVNYMAPFILIHLLLPLLIASGTDDDPARVINLSSVVHTCVADMDHVWDKDPASYSPHAAYSRSKLHLVMFTNHLAHLLSARGSAPRVVVAAVHPGIVNTPLYRHVHPLLQPFRFIFSRTLFRSAHNGAATTIAVAACCLPGEVHGRYFADAKALPSSELSRRQEAQRSLYEATFQQLGVDELPDDVTSFSDTFLQLLRKKFPSNK